MEAEAAPAAEVGDELEEAEGLAPAFLPPADRVSAVPAPVPAGRMYHARALPGPRRHDHHSPPVDLAQVARVEVSVLRCPAVRLAVVRSARIFNVLTFNHLEAVSDQTSVFLTCRLPDHHYPVATDLPHCPAAHVRLYRVETVPQHALGEIVPPRCPVGTDLHYRQPALVVIDRRPCPEHVREETAPAHCPAGIAQVFPATAIGQARCHPDRVILAEGEARNLAIWEIFSASTNRCVLPPCQTGLPPAPAVEIDPAVEIGQLHFPAREIVPATGLVAETDREVGIAQELETARVLAPDWIPITDRVEAAIVRGIALTTAPEIGLIGSTAPAPVTTSSTIARTG